MKQKVLIKKNFVPKIGENIYSIGNSQGNGLSLTNGIISSFNHLTKNNIKTNYIKIYSGASSGNSGSPIFNNQGEIIGITTFRSNSENNSFFYAIAISEIIKFIEENNV
ncbi:trypsin-like peptidase domain-containing protein [[Mycoplasma] collis]|uniref:trypsin-like peptidase domain-containing protein n=1 Tax=[Mycoplasma] collis TaxID=2127 RepID=UPI00051B84A2|nr:trypsin-like peptidase domain-containing protein [[Mycoplasma] collis]